MPSPPTPSGISCMNIVRSFSSAVGGIKTCVISRFDDRPWSCPLSMPSPGRPPCLGPSPRSLPPAGPVVPSRITGALKLMLGRLGGWKDAGGAFACCMPGGMPGRAGTPGGGAPANCQQSRRMEMSSSRTKTRGGTHARRLITIASISRRCAIWIACDLLARGSQQWRRPLASILVVRHVASMVSCAELNCEDSS